MNTVKPILAFAVILGCVSIARSQQPRTSRAHFTDLIAPVVSTTSDTITVLVTNIEVGRSLGRGRTRRPNIKLKENEEVLDVASDVVVKDPAEKDRKGSFESITEGMTVKLKIAKETTRIPGEKQPEVRLVVTQIDIIRMKDKKHP